MTIWECKIGIAEDVELPAGADLPMRRAIERAFLEITGRPHTFNFSGWGGTLTETEAEYVANLVKA